MLLVIAPLGRPLPPRQPKALEQTLDPTKPFPQIANALAQPVDALAQRVDAVAQPVDAVAQPVDAFAQPVDPLAQLPPHPVDPVA